MFFNFQVDSLSTALTFIETIYPLPAKRQTPCINMKTFDWVAFVFQLMLHYSYPFGNTAGFVVRAKHRVPTKTDPCVIG